MNPNSLPSGSGESNDVRGGESDLRDKYSYASSVRNGKWVYVIFEVAKQWDIDEKSDWPIGGIVARIECDGEWDGDGPPPNVRAEYERIIQYKPRPVDLNPLTRPGVVEIIAEPEECSFNQPCIFGHLVDGHAVYCHNEHWLYAPRKCRRSWATGGERRDEDCEGYAPNPSTLNPCPQGVAAK